MQNTQAAFQSANDNGSTATEVVAVDSNQQQSAIRRYFVPVTANVQLALTGDVETYATSEDEAIDKVQDKIDEETLGQLEMKDEQSGASARFGDLKYNRDVSFEIDTHGVEVDDLDEVTGEDVLLSEVEELRAQVSWNVDALTKQRAFLASLIEADSEAA